MYLATGTDIQLLGGVGIILHSSENETKWGVIFDYAQGPQMSGNLLIFVLEVKK